MSAQITTTEKQIKKSIAGKIVDVFVFLVLCIFPLFYTNAYFNILPSKYYFYIGAVVVLYVLLIAALLVEKDKASSYFKNFQMKEFWKKWSITDFAILIFILIAAISTITSDYVYESFWGNEGRYSGLFLLSLYVLAYFAVTRLGTMKKWYLNAFLVVGALMCLWGISDYFKMDIMGFKIHMEEGQKAIFTSSIGNINTYTAIVAMITAVSAVLFSTENKHWKNIVFYYAVMTISLFALIMGTSDNAYLSLAALFGFLPLYLFKDKQGVKRYLVLLATFVSVIQCLDWINTVNGDKVIGIEGAFDILADFKWLLPAVIIFWIVTGLVFLLFNKSKDSNGKIGGWLRCVWVAILGIAVILFAFILWDANALGHAERYQALSNYVTFSDEWGTNRGYIWRNAMECYEKFSPWKKVFGYGPDTFGIVLLDKTAGNPYKQIFDNAHNEYIHYLITVGFAGLAAYVVFLGSYVVRAVRRCLNNRFAVAAMFAVVCYAVQAFVNLNLPIATPIMWMLLMIGEMENRKTAE